MPRMFPSGLAALSGDNFGARRATSPLGSEADIALHPPDVRL